MLNLLEYIYLGLIGLMGLYVAYMLIILWLFWWHKNAVHPPLPNLQSIPHVTVQLPIRNEGHIVQRLLRTVACLDWPSDRLDIQVLDDSDDETTSLIELEVAALRKKGIAVQILHRDRPDGFKAGALAAGLRQTDGEFLAIFDADFMPSPDFLRRTVPYLLADPALGVVQARWAHLNAAYSSITQAQATALDMFAIEMIARNRAGLFIHFLGSAGVWRRRAIEEAGGWQSDTITEDVDLSLRAQLNGWHILYLPQVTVPAELPPLMTVLKQQQYRWAKGHTQCLRKFACVIITSKTLSLFQKVMNIFRIGSYTNALLLCLLLLLILPIVFVTQYPTQLAIGLGMIGSIPSVMHIVAQLYFYGKLVHLRYYPVVILLVTGIMWSTTLAVLDGWFNKGGVFSRTPKFNHIQNARPQITHKSGLDFLLLGELFFGGYAFVVAWLTYSLQMIALLPLMIIYAVGNLLVAWATFSQMWYSFQNKGLDKSKG